MVRRQVDGGNGGIRSAWRLRTSRLLRADARRKRAVHSSALDFVAVIAARHSLRHVTRNGERVWHHGLRPFMVTRLQQFVALRLAPNLEFAIASPGYEKTPNARLAAAVAARDRGPPQIVLRAARHDTFVSSLLQRESRICALDVETRTFVATVLTEIRRRHGDDEPKRAAIANGVPRVLQHAAPSSRELRKAAAAPEASAAARPLAALGAALERAPRQQPIPIDVAALTRTVMRTLDERVVAHRERMGKA